MLVSVISDVLSVSVASPPEGRRNACPIDSIDGARKI
jgi:hypothetical protein